jgi:hypothetical protein
VAARFFSGVPHLHLLGVCCPDFFKALILIPFSIAIPAQMIKVAARMKRSFLDAPEKFF